MRAVPDAVRRNDRLVDASAALARSPKGSCPSSTTGAPTAGR